MLSGESAWEPPSQASSTLPDGWVTDIDEATGETYYYNQLTGQQQWEPPQTSTTKVIWSIAAYNGVAGFSGVTGFAAQNKGGFFQLEYGSEGRPCQLPYTLGYGDEQVLSRWNMEEQALTVSRVQAIVKCQADGSALLTSEGKGATLWRQYGGPWNYLQTDEQVILGDADQVSLDCNDPERAVFILEQQSAL
jgi:hypothetical protein